MSMRACVLMLRLCPTCGARGGLGWGGSVVGENLSLHHHILPPPPSTSSPHVRPFVLTVVQRRSQRGSHVFFCSMGVSTYLKRTPPPHMCVCGCPPTPFRTLPRRRATCTHVCAHVAYALSRRGCPTCVGGSPIQVVLPD